MTLPTATRAELRHLESLREARGRREAGQLLVEGATLLTEALDAGLAPALVAVDVDADAPTAALVERARRAGARVVGVDARRGGRASDRVHAPPLLAAVPLPGAWDQRVAPAGPALVPVLCGIQDPGNVGTLLRSARAFGAAGLLLTEGSADPFGPKVVRASAGAALRLPCARVPLDAALQRAREGTLAPVVAVPPGAARATRGGPLPERCLLLLGHETRGVETPSGCAAVTVPHESHTDSLNVAMAGSILMASWYADTHA